MPWRPAPRQTDTAEREQRILQHGDRQTEQIEHAYLQTHFAARMIPRKGSPRIDRHYLTSIRAVASPYGLLAFTLRIPVSQGLMMAHRLAVVGVGGIAAIATLVVWAALPKPRISPFSTSICTSPRSNGLDGSRSVGSMNWHICEPSPSAMRSASSTACNLVSLPAVMMFSRFSPSASYATRRQTARPVDGRECHASVTSDTSRPDFTSVQQEFHPGGTRIYLHLRAFTFLTVPRPTFDRIGHLPGGRRMFTAKTDRHHADRNRFRPNAT